MLALRLAMAVSLFLSIAGVASAQSPVTPNSSGLGTPTGPMVGGGPQGPTKREPPPPAIPGARTEKTEAAPAQKPPADMPPNEALFDGINRGDTGAVRDALNRGADLSSRNILGLSPTELSVDLGRNDITFLLLSQRGAPTGSDEAPSEGGRAAAPAGKPARLARGGPHRGETATGTPAPAHTRESSVRHVAASPGARAPQRQYAGDGGTPIPQMGFLGFGGTAR